MIKEQRLRIYKGGSFGSATLLKVFCTVSVGVWCLVMILCLILTLCSALWWKKNILALIFVIIQAATYTRNHQLCPSRKFPAGVPNLTV